MHAFIIRPFGTKNGIDFDRTEKKLIRPALEKLEITGGTTGEFIEQGNIRTDMFEHLLIADLVIADISVHNANVFYELGIRHAFRDKRTFLIKSKSEPSNKKNRETNDVPFDLKTDRYFAYDGSNPASSLVDLVDALKATLNSQKQDSPVFQLLPELKTSDTSKILVVPAEFREEVELAAARKNYGDLQLLVSELDGFAWRIAGLRMVGKAQFNINDWTGAKATWEAVCKYNMDDRNANAFLGTIYQRLGEVRKSEQALERAARPNQTGSDKDRAEIYALMARNNKTLWESKWSKKKDLGQRQKAALISPHLERSFELYKKGFVEDRNHFYSGLNALAMGTILLELAAIHANDWENNFDTVDEAKFRLKELKSLCGDLESGVRLAIQSRNTTCDHQGQADIWAKISEADLTLLRSPKPARVRVAYEKALGAAPEMAQEAARNQLLMVQRLGILNENTEAALSVIPASSSNNQSAKVSRISRVLLFTGHRIDVDGRLAPRFPSNKEKWARKMIYEAVLKEKEGEKGDVLGISGAANGGDILFHEVCAELEIPSRIYLALPKSEYVQASVAAGGPSWVDRFQALTNANDPEILSETAELPLWLRAKPHYGIWQRSNLWMLHNALAISNENLSLIALWNGEVGDGPGGTDDMVKRAKDRGAKFIHLDAHKLLE